MAPTKRRAPHGQRRRRPLSTPRAAPVAIDLTKHDLNERRRAVRKAFETAADVVDLTKDDSPPAPLILEDLAVRPVSFTMESGHNIRDKTRSYTLTIDGWKDDDDGSVLSGRVDVYSVTKVVLQPAIGYPVHFLLRPDGRGSLTGTRTYEYYGDNGEKGDDGWTISLDLEKMEAMIQEPWTESGFVASVGFCWAR